MASYEVGQKVKVRYGNGYWVCGTVTRYEPSEARVRVLCEESDGTLSERVVFIIDVQPA